MVGARTEAGPTAAEADTRTGVALMEEAGRTVRVEVEDILVPGGRAEAALISAAAGAEEDSEADSAEAGRREIRRWHGRVAARTEARRHASRAAIPQVLTAVEVMGARPEATAVLTTARGDPATETAAIKMAAAIVDRLMAEIADLTSARDKVGHTTTDTATTPTGPTGIRAPGAAATGRRRIVAIQE
jgi:hypothetical protein